MKIESKGGADRSGVEGDCGNRTSISDLRQARMGQELNSKCFRCESTLDVDPSRVTRETCSRLGNTPAVHLQCASQQTRRLSRVCRLRIGKSRMRKTPDSGQFRDSDSGYRICDSKITAFASSNWICNRKMDFCRN